MSADILPDHLRELIHKALELTEEVAAGPCPGNVHDLRVTIRRIRTDVSLLSPAPGKEEKKRLKKIWKKLGRVRDLDVARELMNEFSLSGAELKDKRRSAREKLSRVLKKDGEKLFEELEKVSLRAQVSLAELSEKINGLQGSLEALPPDADHLHQHRIILKKIRYLREALDFPSEEFKLYQDLLGAYQDLEMVKSFFPEELHLRTEGARRRKKAMARLEDARSLGLRALEEMRRWAKSGIAAEVSKSG